MNKDEFLEIVRKVVYNPPVSVPLRPSQCMELMAAIEKALGK